MEYRLKLDNDTQLQMTTVYERDGRRPAVQKKKKKEAKRTFGVVVKGFMITSVLFSTLISGGAIEALASGNDKVIEDLKPVAQQEVNAFQDEIAMVSNLKMAGKFLDTGIKQGQINIQMFTNVLERIGQIEGKLSVDGAFGDSDSLINTVNLLDAIVKQDVEFEITEDILAKRESTIQAVHDLQEKLGYTSTITDNYNPDKFSNEESELIPATQEIEDVEEAESEALGVASMGGDVTPVVAPPKEEVVITKAETPALENKKLPTLSSTSSSTLQGYQYFDLKYNGATKTAKGVGLYKGTSAFISLYQFNLALGGKLTGSNNTWTLKVGNNTLKYTVGSNIYYVNGVKKVSNKGAVVNVGGNIYVTSDMANVLNYKVTWNTKTKLIAIDNVKQQVVKVDLKVKGKSIDNAVYQDGITYVPIRGVYESLGAKVTTKNGYVNISKDGVSHAYKRDSHSATINGKNINIKGKTITIGNNTMIDVTSVAGVFGAKVSIGNSGKSVTILDQATKSASISVKGSHVEGQVTSKSTIAPIRALFEKLGFTVKSQGNYVVVSKGTDVLMFKKESDTFTVNGKTQYLFDKTQMVGTSYYVDVVGLDGVLGISTSVSNTGQSIAVNMVGTGTTPPVEEVEKPTNNNGGQTQIESENATQQELKEIALKLWNNEKFLFVNPTPKKVGNIMTQYNGHTYKVKNQAQYDAVMKKVKEIITDYYKQAEKSNTHLKLADQGSYLWSTGFQAKDRTQNLGGWKLKEYYDKGYSFEEAIKLFQTQQLGSAVMSQGGETIDVIDSRSNGLENAYQHLFEGLTDCDSEAQAVLVVYDMLGFSTAIYGQANVHADLFVKYKGTYYNASSSLSESGFKEGSSGVYTTTWTQQKFTIGK